MSDGGDYILPYSEYVQLIKENRRLKTAYDALKEKYEVDCGNRHKPLELKLFYDGGRVYLDKSSAFRNAIDLFNKALKVNQTNKELEKEKTMKATLKFDLPEEKELFESAQKGILYKNQIIDFWNLIRNAHKYQDIESWDYEELRQIYCQAFPDLDT